MKWIHAHFYVPSLCRSSAEATSMHTNVFAFLTQNENVSFNVSLPGLTPLSVAAHPPDEFCCFFLSSLRRAYWELITNGESSTAMSFLHLLWLITHCRACKQLWQEHAGRHETTGKNTHPQTHTPLSGISTWVSVRETLLSPQLLYFQAAMSARPCHLFCMLGNTELPLAAGLPQGGKNCLLAFIKQERKTRKNWAVKLLFRHLGWLSCLVTHALILKSRACVRLRRKVKVVVLSNDTQILLHISLTIAVVRSVPIVTLSNHPF